MGLIRSMRKVSRRFSFPSSMHEAIWRVRQNVSGELGAKYMAVPHLILFLGLFGKMECFLPLTNTVISRIVLYCTNHDPSVFYPICSCFELNVISILGLYVIFTVCSLLFLIGTSWINVLLSIVIAFVISLLHATFWKPDDLFLYKRVHKAD